MKTFEIVAVRDNLTESFLAPQFIGSLAEAERLFAHQLNSIALWKDNPNDFELWSLGRYDSESGHIESELHKVANGNAVLKTKGE